MKPPPSTLDSNLVLNRSAAGQMNQPSFMEKVFPQVKEVKDLQKQEERVEQLNTEFSRKFREFGRLCAIAPELPQDQKEIFPSVWLELMEPLLESLVSYITEAGVYRDLLQQQKDAAKQKKIEKLSQYIQTYEEYYIVLQEESAEMFNNNPWLTEDHWRGKTLLAEIARQVMQENPFAPHFESVNDQPIAEQDAIFLERARRNDIEVRKKQKDLDGLERWDLVQEVISKMGKKGSGCQEVMELFEGLNGYRGFKYVVESLQENHQDRQQAFADRQAKREAGETDLARLYAGEANKKANDGAKAIREQIGGSLYMSWYLHLCRPQPIKVYVTDDGKHKIPSFDIGIRLTKEEEDQHPISKLVESGDLKRIRYAYELPLGSCHLTTFAPAHDEGSIWPFSIPDILEGNGYQALPKKESELNKQLFEFLVRNVPIFSDDDPETYDLKDIKIGPLVNHYADVEAEATGSRHSAAISRIDLEKRKIFASARFGDCGMYEYDIHNTKVTNMMRYGSEVRIYESERENGHLLQELTGEEAEQYKASFWDNYLNNNE